MKCNIFLHFRKNFYFANKLYMSTSRLEKGQTGKVGETVGNIIRKIPDLTAGEKEMLQNALDFYYNKKKKEDSI